MPIQNPASLWVCECGCHGHYVLSDGSESDEFISLLDAGMVLLNLMQERRVCMPEIELLTDELEEAGLPPDQLTSLHRIAERAHTHGVDAVACLRNFLDIRFVPLETGPHAVH